VRFGYRIVIFNKFCLNNLNHILFILIYVVLLIGIVLCFGFDNLNLYSNEFDNYYSRGCGGCGIFLGAVFAMSSDNILLDKDTKEIIISLKSEVISKYYDKIMKNGFPKDFVSDTLSDSDFDSNSKKIFETKFKTNFKTKISLNLMGLDFNFINVGDIRYELSDRVYLPLEILILSKILFRNVQSINMKGYVNMNEFEKLFMIDINEHLKDLGYEDKVLGNDENTFTFWYNLIFVNYYKLVLKSLRDIRDNVVIDKNMEVYCGEEVEGVGFKVDLFEDLFDELDAMRVKLLGRIDHSIKQQIMKRGITIMENTYTGFDTEYEMLDEKRCLNRLLSVQTAIQRRIIVKAPRYNVYNLSYSHPLTSEISEFYQPGINDNKGSLYTFRQQFFDSLVTPESESKKGLVYSELDLLNNSIKSCVVEIREFLYASNDKSIKLFVKLAKEIKGVDFYEDEKHDQVVFMFPISAMECSIEYPGEKGYSFLDLLEKSKDSSSDSISWSLSYKNSKITNFKNQTKTFNKFKKTKNAAVFVGGSESLVESTNNTKNTESSLHSVPSLASVPSLHSDSSKAGLSSVPSSNSVPSILSVPSLPSVLSDTSDCFGVVSKSIPKISTKTTTKTSGVSHKIENAVKSAICAKLNLKFKLNLDSSQITDFPSSSTIFSPSPKIVHDTKIFRGGPTISPLCSGCGSGSGIGSGSGNDEIQSFGSGIESNKPLCIGTELFKSFISGKEEECMGNGQDPRQEAKFGVSLAQDFKNILNIFQQSGLITHKDKLTDWYKRNKHKPRTRTKLTFKNDTDTDETTITLSIIKTNFIICHYSPADLSMLSDFDTLKQHLGIVKKVFVTLGKPLTYEHTLVYIRDTSLLAPTGVSTLERIGKLYENIRDAFFNKIKIKHKDLEKMSKFLERDKEAFEKYAIKDAIITLKHAIEMEKFNWSLKQLGIPLTLSSMGRNYVFEEWRKLFKKYLPYQPSGIYKLGDPGEIFSPKALSALGNIGTFMSLFINNYKGGRNESFMYGIDKVKRWFDFDLTSAYTTAMASVSLPDYFSGRIIDINDFRKWDDEQILSGYLIAYVNFIFPIHVKYPSIPCYIDKTTTVYPLTGTAYLTGPEFLLAKNQGCTFKINLVFHIGDKKGWDINEKNFDVIKPFNSIINKIQHLRREFPKGHINNMLYKEMGNSIYGNVVRGMSNKMTFDCKTGKSIRITGTDLSNPIIASWTTAFIRSVIGECLHNINKLGGQVVSVTTDGFITDIDNLEQKLLLLNKKEIPLLLKYRDLRSELSGNPDALELKSEGVGVISWTTRGQQGLSVDGGMEAATGFQKKLYTRDQNINTFTSTLGRTDKFIEFTSSSLRGAKDIFEKGGHVAMKYKDQTFRLFFDNRREIIEPKVYNSLKEEIIPDASNILLDSKPLWDINHCRSLRFLAKFPITLPFNKNATNRAKSGYNTKLEIAVRSLIKAYYNNTETFGFKGNEFPRRKDLIAFISGITSTKDIKLPTPSSICHLVNRNSIIGPVPFCDSTKTFVDIVKRWYPYFKDDLFLRPDPDLESK
jgi:hypothetical protein